MFAKLTSSWNLCSMRRFCSRSVAYGSNWPCPRIGDAHVCPFSLFCRVMCIISSSAIPTPQNFQIRLIVWQTMNRQTFFKKTMSVKQQCHLFTTLSSLKPITSSLRSKNASFYNIPSRILSKFCNTELYLLSYPYQNQQWNGFKANQPSVFFLVINKCLMQEEEEEEGKWEYLESRTSNPSSQEH